MLPPFGYWVRLRARLRRSFTKPQIPNDDRRPRLFVVVEGTHDVQFLRRVSAMLHAADPQLPDLDAMDRASKLVFVPFGGGEIWPWTYCLSGLGCAEFFLLDREVSPVTETRLQAAAIVNLRPRCRAVVMKKRSLENYLDPRAIFEARGINISFGDDDNVADLAAQAVFAAGTDKTAWDQLPVRSRKRRRNRTKQWLNTEAVERMTAERLADRDPNGEIRSWLATIAELAQ